MSVRLARPSDAEAIGQIRVAAWRAAYRRFMPTEFLASLDPSANLSALRDQLVKPTSAFKVFVAECSGSAAGFAIIGAPRYESKPHSIELWALNVLPVYWRQGIGANLIHRSVGEATSLGFSSIELWCINGNLAAEAAYERCGFIRTNYERSSSTLTGHPLHEIMYTKVL